MSKHYLKIRLTVFDHDLIMATTIASKYLTLFLATIAIIAAVRAQPWILEVSGCSSQYKFFLAQSRNGACLYQGDGVWRKITCTSNEFFAYNCLDSGCDNCTLLETKKLQGCHTPPNQGVYCSINEPNYAIYAGPHYVEHNEYASDSKCTGPVLTKRIWKTPYCASFLVGGGGFSYLATCEAESASWELFNDPLCGTPSINRTEPVNQCFKGNIINTCV